jgi:hypothetical protein
VRGRLLRVRRLLHAEDLALAPGDSEARRRRLPERLEAERQGVRADAVRRSSQSWFAVLQRSS